jgi:hypothetical protein
MDRRLPNYVDFDNIAINPRDNMRNHELVTDPDVPFNDAYEAEHVFGVTRCMLCEGPMDSAAHGFIDCERIQTLVWRAIMPTLHKLTGSRVGVPLDLRNVVLGWPELKMPPSFRARLLLWRDITIHILSRKRWDAITAGLNNDTHPVLVLMNFAAKHATLVASTLVNGFHKCSETKRKAFVKRWLERGSFLRQQDDTLVFLSMSLPTPKAS